MPTAQEIKSLVDQMPELDVQPPPPPEPPPPPPEPTKQSDPTKPNQSANQAKPATEAKADPAKPTDPPREPQRERPRDRPRRPEPPQVKGKLTGPPWEKAQLIYTQILAGGQPSVELLIDLIPEKDTGPAYKPRYVLHGLALFAARPENKQHRAPIIQAITSKLKDANKPSGIRAFLIRTLQVCGDGDSALPAVAPLLQDPILCDAAAQTLVAIGGPNAATHLRDALAKANGRPRLAIIQALGQLKDSTAAQTLLHAAADESESENVRLTAMWVLARATPPPPGAADVILKAADAATETWPRSQATKAALLLAENLAAGGRKTEAARIYRHLVETRTHLDESHVREAAELGLASQK